MTKKDRGNEFPETPFFFLSVVGGFSPPAFLTRVHAA